MNKNLIVAVGGFVALITLLSIVYLVMNSRNPYGDELQIRNLSEYTSGRPTNADAVAQAKNQLFITVNGNNEGITNNSVKDILIRDESFSQRHDEEANVHYVDFIVDSESLQQSYLVTYEWTDDPNNTENLDPYPVLASCLPEEQLIYGDFGCEDLGSDMSGTRGPYIVIDWYSAEDEYGNDINSQLQPHEIMFIESQILGDYRANNELTRMEVNSITRNLQRDISTANTFSFDIEVEGDTTYSVSVDYDDDRHLRIQNTSTNKVIERKDEVF